ncbi:SCO2521 family protein [Nocardia sp. NPDC050710]|uniref:SCO2521 family protein n=1 Tax=Nocardia sp. NPDC050710 TaxID=3157220 RepID=UPI0033D4989C
MTDPVDPAAHPLVVLGEVRTCLVPDSGALSRSLAADLLALVPGRRVLFRERPIPIAASPTTAVGVDCTLATGTNGGVRAIGTVAVNAVVVGGRILQSSARTMAVVAPEKRRRDWSHYLAQVGVTEVVSKVDDTIPARLADGFLNATPPPETLDLSSIGERLLRRIRRDARLDQHPPILGATTRLRWIARIAEVPAPQVSFHVADETVRTVRVLVRDTGELAEARRFCEDLAAHDWLLTATAAAVEEADRFPSASSESVQILAPVLEQLAHLWMPGAHVAEPMRVLWAQLQQEPGFTEQWLARIGHLRDRMTVATLAALRVSKLSTTDW